MHPVFMCVSLSVLTVCPLRECRQSKCMKSLLTFDSYLQSKSENCRWQGFSGIVLIWRTSHLAQFSNGTHSAMISGKIQHGSYNPSLLITLTGRLAKHHARFLLHPHTLPPPVKYKQAGRDQQGGRQNHVSLPQRTQTSWPAGQKTMTSLTSSPGAQHCQHILHLSKGRWFRVVHAGHHSQRLSCECMWVCWSITTYTCIYIYNIYI